MIKSNKRLSTNFIKRVLTIDLDYLSNNIKIDKTGNIIIDKFKFDFIKKLVDKYRVNSKFIENHGMVPIMLKKDGFLDNYYDVEIVNIDHHHDIYYKDDEYRDLLRYANHFKNTIPHSSELENCWVGWICTNWNVTRCDEILNEHSSIDDTLLSYGIRFHKKLGSPFNPYGLDIFDKKFHYIYIVSSPDYITPDQFEFICNYLNIDKNSFMKDGDIK